MITTLNDINYSRNPCQVFGSIVALHPPYYFGISILRAVLFVRSEDNIT